MHPEYTVLWLPSPTPSLGWHSWGNKSSMTVFASFQSLQKPSQLEQFPLDCWHVPWHYSKRSTTVKSFHINWTRGWHIAALIAITYFLHIYTIILIEQTHRVTSVHHWWKQSNDNWGQICNSPVTQNSSWNILYNALNVQAMLSWQEVYPIFVVTY